MDNKPSLRVVIAPDSYKGSLNALEVAEAMTEGVKTVMPDAQTILLPVADGGEGTVDSIVRALSGEKIEVTVKDPLNNSVKSCFGLIDQGETAIIEMAAASGLPLVPKDLRDPRYTTTYGTGQLMIAAMERGARRIILGIGGSATNDGGAGMAQALGIRLLDEEGQELPLGGLALSRLRRLDFSQVYPALAETEIIAACDVANPLTGPQGASAIYGPQKGATPDMVQELDQALQRMAEVIREDLGIEVEEIPGAGAAGGLGAGLIAFAKARLEPGFPLLAELLKLGEEIARADLVLTGEGAIDAQTAFGKVPMGLAQIAARHQVPIVAIGGSVSLDVGLLYSLGIDGLYPITNRPMALEEAMQDAYKLVKVAAQNALSLILTGSRLKHFIG